MDEDFVSISEIAERVNVSREAVRLWAEQRRLDGSFPAPVAMLSGGKRLWDWASVELWLETQGKITRTEVSLTREEVAAVNTLLAVRNGMATWQFVADFGWKFVPMFVKSVRYDKAGSDFSYSGMEQEISIRYLDATTSGAK